MAMFLCDTVGGVICTHESAVKYCPRGLHKGKKIWVGGVLVLHCMDQSKSHSAFGAGAP